ncbi:MAG: SMI1/KNR4 family protein [Verrucomicrobiaceae bacterium]|nr:SMI1/KNR4 family protein [Verrucomicrobiaceae bacterium]
MTSFKSPGKQLSNTDIERVEQKLKLRFPACVRELYLHSNGGRPDDCLFISEQLFEVVCEFLPLDLGSGLSITPLTEHYLDMVVDRKFWSAHLVPFADDPGGNFFLFDSSAEEGWVYFWTHDTAFDPLTPLHVGFADFWAQLTSEE